MFYVGCVMGKRVNSWDYMYKCAKAYYEKYGNLEIPSRFVTDDGVIYNEYGTIKLGMWLAKQRQRCNPLSEHGKLLSKIGMRFDKKKVNLFSWEQMYEYAKAYSLKYGTLEVPSTFSINEDIVYDKNGCIKLGKWLYDQKRYCTSDSEHRKLLMDIGLNFEKEKSYFVYRMDMLEWMKMYAYAVEFYQEYGNLVVPKCYKNKDGVDLGEWLFRQKRYYKNGRLSSEKICMLESIGIIWDVRKNKFNIAVLCDKMNINIQKNKFVLGHISSIEFKVKLLFLKDNNIDIVDKNGLLHEIFSMSSMIMLLKYSVSLGDLVSRYSNEMSK